MRASNPNTPNTMSSTRGRIHQGVPFFSPEPGPTKVAPTASGGGVTTASGAPPRTGPGPGAGGGG